MRPGERRRASAILAALLPLYVFAQEPQFFEEPKPKPKLSLRWDFLARYDHVEGAVGYEELNRGRFEFRPELDLDFSDRLRLGVRGVFDYGTQAESIPFYDNYVSRGAAVDRYYLLWRPATFSVWAGKFGMPLVVTPLLWDKYNLQAPGGAVSWQSPGGAWTLAGGGFTRVQLQGDRSIVGAGQVVWRTGDESRLALEAAASYWGYDLKDMKPVYIRQNTFLLVDGNAVYASDFHVGDLLLRLRFPIGSLPTVVSLDGIYNFAADAGRRAGFDATVAVGRLGTPGQWRAFYAYQYVQRDAVVGAYNTDDWWLHSWYEGHRVGVGVTVLPQVYLQPAATFVRRLDQTNWIRRYTVDLVKLF